MIRAFQKDDVKRVMEIWLEGNIEAHHFVSKEYWLLNYQTVQEQILQAEIYVYESDEKIKGFAGVMDDYIAGIFVDKKYRSMRVGKQLLDYVKEVHSSLSLGVYQKNKRAVDFYLREGFLISAEGLDEETGEEEYIMSWCKM